MIDFKSYLNNSVIQINNTLKELTSTSSFSGRESGGFNVMLEAMSYSLENGGKRIRPFLVVEFCKLFGGDSGKALIPACATEMVHTYSLIHDDLPCMDNDDIRRGKPSNHIKFGYANALLAGDALLTLAFETISKDTNLSGDIKSEIIYELSVAAGASGMIAGQVMDLQNENKNVDIITVELTDQLKTGKMICASGKIGCIIAGADDKCKSDALDYCRNIGLAFQVIDDILDVISTDEILGKPIKSDFINNKSTYVSLLGLEKAKKYAEGLTQNAVDSISDYDNNSVLIQFAYYLLNRIS
ncbi:MAG: polyprenyl synthetase family protein [Clostridia bacterium]|nr:polyprenyl synthetase family protein [Clostridia bacterium]